MIEPFKAATVSFGQPIPPAVWAAAEAMTAACDAFVAVGSSLVVRPAARLPVQARRLGATLLIVRAVAAAIDPGLAREAGGARHEAHHLDHPDDVVEAHERVDGGQRVQGARARQLLRCIRLDRRTHQTTGEDFEGMLVHVNNVLCTEDRAAGQSFFVTTYPPSADTILVSLSTS